MSRIDTLDEAIRLFSDTRAGLARLIDRCGGDSGADYPGDWHTQLIELAGGALPVFAERDALAAKVEQLTQEREIGAALDSEARAHDEIYVLDLIEQRDMLVVEVKRLRSFMFVFGPKMGTRR